MVTILLVEDGSFMRRALRDHLVASGFSLVVCDSVEDVMERDTLDLDVDVIVTDHILEDGYGVKLISRLRKRLGREIPAVVTSGWELSQESLPEACEFLKKPFDLGVLTELIWRSVYRDQSPAATSAS